VEAAREADVRVNEHEAKASGRGRLPGVAALGNDEARVLGLERFGVQKSIGRIAVRDAHGRWIKPADEERAD
jgi:hypothetical protein